MDRSGTGGALGRIARLGFKEILSVVRDLGLLLFIVYAFTGDVQVAGEGISLEVRNGAIAVVDEDDTPLSRSIIDGFQMPFFQPPQRISYGEVAPGLDSGRFTFAVILPKDLEADLVAGRVPGIQVNVDATAVTQAYVGASYIQQIILRKVAEHAGGSPDLTGGLPIDARIRVLFNPNRTDTWYSGLTELLQMVAVMSLLLPAIALLREKEHGTVEHLLVMPVSPAEIMLSKILANGVIVLVGSVIGLLLVVHGWFGAPIVGSVALFLLVTALFLVTTSGLSMVLATIASNVPQLGLLVALVLSPMIFLSGAYTPAESMPQAVRWLMVVSPLTYYVDAATAIVFRGAGLSLLWRDLLALAGSGVLFFAIALVRFRKAMAGG